MDTIETKYLSPKPSVPTSLDNTKKILKQYLWRILLIFISIVNNTFISPIYTNPNERIRIFNHLIRGNIT